MKESEEVLSSSDRRRSGRNAGHKSYAEQGDSEDDADMREWDRDDEDNEEKGGDEEDSTNSHDSSEEEPISPDESTFKGKKKTKATESRAKPGRSKQVDEAAKRESMRLKGKKAPAQTDKGKEDSVNDSSELSEPPLMTKTSPSGGAFVLVFRSCSVACCTLRTRYPNSTQHGVSLVPVTTAAKLCRSCSALYIRFYPWDEHRRGGSMGRVIEEGGQMGKEILRVSWLRVYPALSLL